MSSMAVVGVGNSLLTDDGAGIHALAHFASENSRDDVRCLDAGTVGLALMDYLSELEGLIAIDAMRLGQPPGTVTLFEGGDMDAQLKNHHGSVHELGLSDLMDALRLAGELPPRRALIGIEPGRIGWGTELTGAVAAAIPAASARVHALLDEWRASIGREAAA